MSNFYIGFTKLEEFAVAINPIRPLYLAPLIRTTHGNQLSTVTAYVIASQVADDHLIYFKMNTARWEEMYGNMFGEKSAERAAAAPHLQRQLWGIAAHVIRAAFPDIFIYEGAPSLPSDLVLIEGWPECATYDKDTNTIEIKD